MDDEPPATRRRLSVRIRDSPSTVPSHAYDLSRASTDPKEMPRRVLDRLLSVPPEEAFRQITYTPLFGPPSLVHNLLTTYYDEPNADLLVLLKHISKIAMKEHSNVFAVKTGGEQLPAHAAARCSDDPAVVRYVLGRYPEALCARWANNSVYDLAERNLNPEISRCVSAFPDEHKRDVVKLCLERMQKDSSMHHRFPNMRSYIEATATNDLSPAEFIYKVVVETFLRCEMKALADLVLEYV